ncbi:MAG: hypothetical protein A2045_16470 [Rhodocyclales bacterium GWA2_65_20]|nr:MAG: hypothetical protein A2045_16470 [Rhodocyclales bacterium GWA2_65_20]
MNTRIKKIILMLSIVLSISLTACAAPLTDSDFVGKWQSTKLSTPLFLHGNGEWEIKTGDDTVLQYGVWRYENHKFIWTVKIDNSFQHDANEVLAFSRREFQLREGDGSVTTFMKLD